MSSVWMWSAVGVILLAGEVITTSFVLLFFAFAAVATAGIVALQPGITLPAQLITFGVLGLAGLLVGRKWIKEKILAKASPAFQSDSNSEFTVDRDIAPGAEGAVLYQGSPWTAVNDGSEPILVGNRVKVTRTSGIKIMIVKVN